jgi:hypothetical protein
LSISTPKAKAICWAMLGQPQMGLRCFIATTASMSSFFGSLPARPTPALGRKQHAVLASPQHVVEMQQSGRLQNDGGAENADSAHEKSTQTGDDTIRGAQVGCTLAAAIEDQQLMPTGGKRARETGWSSRSSSDRIH